VFTTIRPYPLRLGFLGFPGILLATSLHWTILVSYWQYHLILSLWRSSKNFTIQNLQSGWPEEWKKIAQILEKVAQSVAKLKKNWHNHLHYPLLNSVNTDNRSYFHPKNFWPFKKKPKWRNFSQSGHPASNKDPALKSYWIAKLVCFWQIILSSF